MEETSSKMQHKTKKKKKKIIFKWLISSEKDGFKVSNGVLKDGSAWNQQQCAASGQNNKQLHFVWTDKNLLKHPIGWGKGTSGNTALR